MSSEFIGSITDENSRKLNIELDFLEAGQSYSAKIYKDAQDANWDKNPTAINIQNLEVTRGTKWTLYLASGGGTAISIKKN